MSSAQGRFVSVDWSERPEPVPYSDFENPQSINLFVYAHNNPLVVTDPDGHCPWCVGAGIGALGGAISYIVVQKLNDQPISGRALLASTLGGAVVGATLGLGTGAAALTTLSGTTSIATGTAVRVGVGAAAGALGGITQRTIESGSLKKGIGTTREIATDATVGAVSEGLNKAIEPAVKSLTSAGQATGKLENQMSNRSLVGISNSNLSSSNNTAKLQGRLGAHQGTLGLQQQAIGAAAGTALDAAVKLKQAEKK